jgi:hypothetical protein
MKPAVANTRFTIPPAKLFHHVKQNTARIILNAAKASTIHGRYLPIFIKKVRITITPSSFAVLGIALSDDDDESFSTIWVSLYCTTNNLSINKYPFSILLTPPTQTRPQKNADEEIRQSKGINIR